MIKNQRIWFASILIIILFAFLIRVIFSLIYPTSPLAGGDQTAFWSYAEGIASGNGFRSTFEPWLADRPPLYSYFLAGVFKLAGSDRTIVFIAQAFLGSIAAGLFYVIAVRLLGARRGLVAGLIFCLFPHFLLFTQQILTEALYIPLYVCLLSVLLMGRSLSNLPLRWCAIGLLLGLIALVRREAVLPAFVVVLWAGWLRMDRDWRRFLVMIASISLVAVLTLVPWLQKNARLLGRPVLSSSVGVNFMVGNNPLADGAYSPPPAGWQAQLAGKSELERDRISWQLSMDWIQANPGEWVRLIPLKLSVFWGPAYNWVLDGADILLLVLSIIALFRFRWHASHYLMVISIALPPVVLLSIVTMIFVGGWRYRLVVYPGLLLWAAFGIPNSLLNIIPKFLLPPEEILATID